VPQEWPTALLEHALGREELLQLTVPQECPGSAGLPIDSSSAAAIAGITVRVDPQHKLETEGQIELALGSAGLPMTERIVFRGLKVKVSSRWLKGVITRYARQWGCHMGIYQTLIGKPQQILNVRETSGKPVERDIGMRSVSHGKWTQIRTDHCVPRESLSIGSSSSPILLGSVR
jgi:hypothetical protein